MTSSCLASPAARLGGDGGRRGTSCGAKAGPENYKIQIKDRYSIYVGGHLVGENLVATILCVLTLSRSKSGDWLLLFLLLLVVFCDLQRVSCWSLLGRKTSSEQPLAPYLHGSPIIPTIFSNAWFGASTNVCLQILQLFNPCDFLIWGGSVGEQLRGAHLQDRQ